MKQLDYSRIKNLNELRLARLHNKVLRTEARYRLSDSIGSFRHLLSVEGLLLWAFDAGKIMLLNSDSFRRGYRWAQAILKNIRR